MSQSHGRPEQGFFKHKGRQGLETIPNPHRFHFFNPTETTGIGFTSKSLVDNIITDLPAIEGAVTYLSDNPLRTSKKNESGPAMSTNTNI